MQRRQYPFDDDDDDDAPGLKEGCVVYAYRSSASALDNVKPDQLKRYDQILDTSVVSAVMFKGLIQL